MTWESPGLSELRAQTRDAIARRLKVGALLPNSRARILADATAGLARLNLEYVDWLAEQIFPDKAGEEWLRGRHAEMWLGGAKAATFASGAVLVSGAAGSIVPAGARIVYGSAAGLLNYEVETETVVGASATAVPVFALSAGAVGNLDPGTELSFASAPDGVEATVAIQTMDGGVDAESVDYLRARVLQRIRNPPMGGAADDYVRWALEVPGVTRAWSAPNEMGIGTVTVRVMFDELRAEQNGIPNESDLATVRAHFETVRPVAVKDFFVVAPQLFSVSFGIANLAPDTVSVRAAISQSVAAMIRDRAAPASSKNGVRLPPQTIYKAWVSKAILDAPGVDSFDLVMSSDATMPNNGSMARLGMVSYA